MLTERKKADRAKMANEVEKLALELGATVTREEEGENSICPRRVQLQIRAARGLCVFVEFDGQSCQHDVYVVPWHMALDTDACLSNAFGTVNQFHFSKATHVAYGFEALCRELERGLSMAADGSAFDAEREAQQIAKHGTAAERAERFAKWREEWKAERDNAA